MGNPAQHTTPHNAGGAYGAILDACVNDSRSGALIFAADLEPLDGFGEPVAPPTYPAADGSRTGPRWQFDRRWESPDAPDSADTSGSLVIILDQLQSQAKRIGLALEDTAGETGVPLIVLDLDGITLPVHIQRRISNMQWAHRNADAYLRDASLDGQDFHKHPIGRALTEATPSNAAALISWFPTAAAFGFWVSNFGSKRQQTRLARSWKSEIVGWDPAIGVTPTVRFGLKSDELVLSKDVKITRRDKREKDDLLAGWDVDDKGKTNPSAIGHGAVPYSEGERQTLAPVSFRKITQQASLVFPQVRRLGVGNGDPAQDAAARALVVCLLVHGHLTAFDRPFVLRSGCGLSPVAATARLDAAEIGFGDTAEMVRDALEHARKVGVPLEGWDRDEPLKVTPNDSLRKTITATWPDLDAESK